MEEKPMSSVVHLPNEVVFLLPSVPFKPIARRSSL